MRIAISSVAIFGSEVNGVQIKCEAMSSDWLWSVIAAFANAASDAFAPPWGKYGWLKESL